MTHSTARDRQQLEQLWRVPPAPHSPKQGERSTLPVLRWLKVVGNSLVSFLTDTQQLRLWTKNTRSGKLWFAYDPTTGQTVSHNSEAALRVWLEQRHYR
ncbi:hypothetical protein [cf. Phormidesmis sp. LEGE 11477]|uniref:hypothetical protein n=1 Tax=cf. Phormidesmis sp. LEGE 11477 TaxID=1828680 RepID=UPI001882BE98|nr:hypothetical protein [cf. Phormidesmis sp. LEGE 11477]MBE9063245.1 hypothetical protein [cf. Phormidesmis sp. LEGE 11477]